MRQIKSNRVPFIYIIAKLMAITNNFGACGDMKTHTGIKD